MNDILSGLVAGAAYGAVSLIVMFVGYLLVDLLTPGKLRDLIWKGQSNGAAAIVAVDVLGTAWIVRQAILSSHDGLLLGLASTAVFSLLGVLLMALAFVVIDALTPGRLGEIITERAWHPATLVTIATHAGVALVMAAAIS